METQTVREVVKSMCQIQCLMYLVELDITVVGFPLIGVSMAAMSGGVKNCAGFIIK